MRRECGARMQRVPDLAEDRVSLGEVWDDQRLHDPGGTLALSLGQLRPGLKQPGAAVFAYRRVQGGGHRRRAGRLRESPGVIVGQVACREAVVVDRWERQGPGWYGLRTGPEPELGMAPARSGAHLLGDRGIGHLREPALVDGLE